MSTNGGVRCCGFYADQPRAGWTAHISPLAISVIFPTRHWELLRERSGSLADGKSWAESDVDALCESIKRELMPLIGTDAA